jgi:hypothetical protein
MDTIQNFKPVDTGNAPSTAEIVELLDVQLAYVGGGIGDTAV